jgi:putative transposase
MTDNKNVAESVQARWARFRFSIIGPLLAAPPQSGELQNRLIELAQFEWRHPINGQPVKFSVSTLERWFYRAKSVADPVSALRTKHRSDALRSRTITAELKQMIQSQYRDHPSWSYQLHVDNLRASLKQGSQSAKMPSYQTIRRYMKANACHKQRNIRRFNTVGAERAAERLESREVRSFEVDYVHGLWHLDFHHGKRKILGKDGKWHKPLLLTIMDDHSRLACHSQWYFDETAESLVHGFMQALQKRGLPRALMSDNGSAMISGEFCQGLERLSILHQPTLPYSPYQNAKQEVFWAQVEGRLMAMLESEPNLTLSLLNEATLAWVEFEYHRSVHSELKVTPLECYTKDAHVGRPCPSSADLKAVFRREVKRKQRRSDGTFTLDGHRFEVPSAYRHLESLCVRYASWDLSTATLIDPHTNSCLSTLYPQDKSANADGLRRALKPAEGGIQDKDRYPSNPGIAPLLKALMAEYAATGLPPAYLPKEKLKSEPKSE